MKLCLKNDSIISYANLVNGKGIVTLAVDEQDRVWLGIFGTGELAVFDGTNLTIITDIEDEQFDFIPQQYSLNQNYPNPFNPTTTIKFGIAEFGFVSLKVYDILGNEITTLVNEEKPSGNYEVEFNASSLPSGVYFYRLKSGSFVETKKMIVLK